MKPTTQQPLHLQYPEAYRRALEVAPNMAEMMRHFSQWNAAGRAIGHTTGNAFRNLHTRPNGCPSLHSEGAAKLWVRSNVRTGTEPPAPELNIPQTPAPQPKPTVQAGGLILVAGPNDALAKIKRVATMLGCEVVD